MLGITWQGVKTYIDQSMNMDAASGVFLVKADGLKLTGTITPKKGIPKQLSTVIDAGQADALRLLVRKFHERERPDAIDAALLKIDWQREQAETSIFYKRNGELLRYDERHTFGLRA